MGSELNLGQFRLHPQRDAVLALRPGFGAALPHRDGGDRPAADIEDDIRENALILRHEGGAMRRLGETDLLWRVGALCHAPAGQPAEGSKQ